MAKKPIEKPIDKNDPFALALAECKKEFGDEAIMTFDDGSARNVEFTPSGSIALDLALGGGFPKGRIVEIYGPESSGKTTCCLHAVAERQKLGGKVVYIDVEHALDPSYMAALGIDLKSVAISQPDCAEQAFDIAEKMIPYSDLVVIDSVAAMVPKAERDGEMGDSNIGLQARVMSKGLRKITPLAHKSNCLVIFVNQIRMKIGVMFGCLHGSTLVNLTDGRSLPIKEIVENKIQANVWTYNEETGEIEEKPIIGWNVNGKVENASDWINIQTVGIDGSGGKFGTTVTPDHLLLTENGWKESKNITLSDKLMSKYESVVNGTLKQFLYGTLCGDSTLSVRSQNTACFKLQDAKNEEYLKWKVAKIEKTGAFTFKVNDSLRGGNKYISNFTYENKKLKEQFTLRDPLVMLEDTDCNALSLALWYMDDGNFDGTAGHCRSSISVKRFKNDATKLEAICSGLKSKYALEATYSLSSGNIKFTKAETLNLHALVAEYVPDCMQYKLDETCRGKFVDFDLTSTKILRSEAVPVLEINVGSPRMFKAKTKYDLTVLDNENFIAGGIHNGYIVHNSPETTSGGNALKFYASQRLDVRRTTSPIKEGSGKEEAAVGNATKIKVIKNKVAPPFRVAELDIRYGEGFDKIKEALDFGVLYNIIGKSGAFYSYGDVKLQGAAKARAWLVENPEIREEITAKIFKAIESAGVIEKEEDTISKLMGGMNEPSILDHVKFDQKTGEIISDDPLDHVE